MTLEPVLSHRQKNVLVQVGTFGDPGRDPRGWTVTVAYAALVPSTSLGVKAAVSGDAGCMAWLHHKHSFAPAYIVFFMKAEKEGSSDLQLMHSSCLNASITGRSMSINLS